MCSLGNICFCEEARGRHLSQVNITGADYSLKGPYRCVFHVVLFTVMLMILETSFQIRQLVDSLSVLDGVFKDTSRTDSEVRQYFVRKSRKN